VDAGCFCACDIPLRIRPFFNYNILIVINNFLFFGPLYLCSLVQLVQTVPDPCRGGGLWLQPFIYHHGGDHLAHPLPKHLRVAQSGRIDVKVVKFQSGSLVVAQLPAQEKG
jgi:hypothetical protein